MSPSPDQKEPIVEPTPSDGQSDELTARALRQRIRQQELLAELGILALQRTSFIDMLDHTARMTAEGLGAEYCKVMEYLPAENRLLVRAGVGWGEGVVGVASVGADLESPAGYALRTGKPVISNHLENEQRFRTPVGRSQPPRGCRKIPYMLPAASLAASPSLRGQLWQSARSARF
jgi:GAF domain-containing protein